MAARDDSQTAAVTDPPEWLRAVDSRLRLHTMVRLRWLAVLGQTVTVIGVHWGLGMDLPIGWCFAVIALSAWLNVALRIRYPASQRLKNNYAFYLLGYDIIQLAALLYLTGGLENPFAFLLIAPVTVSASSLPPRITIALGVLAIGAATLLVSYHYPLPWCHHADLGGAILHPVDWCHDTQIDFPLLYRIGVWAAVVLGIVFIGFYSWRTAEEGRRMAEALAATEMVLAREQKLSALDGLAAAAAHGLGTPLSTIAVVTKELLRDTRESDPNYEDMQLLRAQAERCREILKELTAHGEQLDIIVSRLPVTHLIDDVVEPHRLMGVPIEIKAGPGAGVAPDTPAGCEPVAQRNPGVIYGLGNLVENAVDFAATKVEIEASWSKDEVRIVIADDGEGFPAAVLEQLGEPFVTTRPGESQGEAQPDEQIGMGLGFFIAKTLLERSGAELELANRQEPETGAVVTVIWPRGKFEQTAAGAPVKPKPAL
jgi:two-component system sensor histidine kinase RegB